MPRPRLRDEFRDPWGPLLGAVLGGVTWAVGVPVLAAVGVGAAVYGVKAVTGALLDDGAPPIARSLLVTGSAAAGWLDRAQAAVADLQEQAATGDPASLTGAAAVRSAQDADAVLEALRRVAGQQAAVTGALRRADSPGLDAELSAARADTARGQPDAGSLQALEDRVAVRERLRVAQQQLLVRLQGAALGLEGLSARVAELVALAADAGAVDPSSEDLRSLTREVEGLRQGLVESEQATRGVLGQG